MSGNKCKNCGSTDIETDPARGDAVCTQCGFVLEDQIIVNENEFTEGPAGNIMVIGHFVSSESSGGATTRFGSSYVSGKESRELTIKNARKGITHLCNQLQLKKHYIDQAVTYYRLALEKNLTRGRKQSHNHAACVYITCRTASTEHMLIDISDVLQICVHELGRTYLKFTQALCIKPPSIDPCLYVMRFANQLQFGDKTHEVSMTALRVVQRMKRDSIHSGRRPSGLCGAALLIAARLHEFNRSTADIIKIVKVHESTLRKRLIEFGETPSSALTLEEFMSVDLEEEQDPPAFKAAKKKDRERINMMQNVDQELNELQNEIEKHLDLPKYSKKKKEDPIEFIRESNFNALQTCVEVIGSPNDAINTNVLDDSSIGLGPNMASMGLNNSISKQQAKEKNEINFENETGEINLSDIDDDELNGYIMSEKEAQDKSSLWHKVNEKYLEEQKEKEEKKQKDKEEGKPEKKRKKAKKTTKSQTPANSAGEAIEKMLQEKKISSKINYEVLKNLSIGNSSSQKNADISPTVPVNSKNISDNFTTSNIKVPAIPKITNTNVIGRSTSNLAVKRKLEDDSLDEFKNKKALLDDTPNNELDVSDDLVDDYYDDYVDDDVEPEESEMTVRDMLKGQNADEDDDEYGYDYDDYDEY